MEGTRMDENLRTQIETYLAHLDGLIRRGRQVRDTLTAEPSNPSAMAATRAWQEDCGVTVNQLSGGSKAHWLARSFSESFLMRSADGRAATGAAPTEIVTRLIGVLEQAVATLSAMGDGSGVPGSSVVSADLNSFTTLSSGRFSSKPTSTADAPSSKRTMTWRCALPAESWKPL